MQTINGMYVMGPDDELNFEIGDCVMHNRSKKFGVVVNKIRKTDSFSYNTKYLMCIKWENYDVIHKYYPLKQFLTIISDEKEILMYKIKYSDGNTS